MKIEKAFRGLRLIGGVEGKRSFYNVFVNEKDNMFVLFSLKDTDKGNFTIVNKKITDLVYRHFAKKKGITSKDIQKSKKFSNNFRKSRFNFLNCAYVLVALKKAKIVRGVNNNALYFNFS